jgi:hypothetical protein
MVNLPREEQALRGGKESAPRHNRIIVAAIVITLTIIVVKLVKLGPMLNAGHFVASTLIARPFKPTGRFIHPWLHSCGVTQGAKDRARVTGALLRSRQLNQLYSRFTTRECFPSQLLASALVTASRARASGGPSSIFFHSLHLAGCVPPPPPSDVIDGAREHATDFFGHCRHERRPRSRSSRNQRSLS